MKNREKILITVSAFIISAIAIGLFVFMPLKDNITRLNSDIRDKRIVLEITKRRSENLTVLKNDYENIQNKNKLLDAMYISQDNTISFFKDLEDAAQKNNIDLNYSLGNMTDEISGKEVKLDINIKGDYLKILAFLSDLESLDYYIKLYSINFTQGEAQSANAIIQAKTYWH